MGSGLIERDITYQKFNNLVAIGRDPNKKKNYWVFKCTCGKTKSILKYDVIRGKTTNCGCIKGGPLKKLEKVKTDLIGKIFGRLTVKSFAFVKQGNSHWNCLCICGKEIIVPRHALKSGNTTSCGCSKIYKYKQGELGLNRLYTQYKVNAKNSGRVFNISKEDFKELTSNDCTYCGSKPSLSISIRNNKDRAIQEYSVYMFNGLDRVDSDKGYELNNVVTCCIHCNIAKRDRPVKDFIAHITNIYNHTKGKNYA